ncbi:MAG: PIG-L family deacetylase [Acidobacteriia bacterium]|nr:PIG-L family deacetylase [Terriglobia bacterium]
MKTIALLAAALTLWLAAPAAAQFPPAPGTGTGLAETVEAIDSARVTTRILYVTAHPDDESSSVLTYLARGLHADVALLSLTRGEGGQNALGPEQAPQLGLIRSQELLAATRGYGVQLFFTRAPDFGFSKTPEESERIWGDQVLDDMVRVIRTFRPNIVINNWGGVHSGHGHHQAAGLLTPKAVQMAADPKAFPAQLQEGLRTWGGAAHPVEILGLERGGDNPKGYILPLDEISPLYGKSWRQIGLDAFVNHRTQGISGFIGSPYIWRPIALTREDGAKLDPAILARPLTSLFGEEQGQLCKSHPDWCATVKTADEKIASAHAAALKLDWPAAAEFLAQASESMSSLYPADAISFWDPLNPAYPVVGRISHALLLASGFEFTAEADRSEAVVGEPVTVTVRYGCRRAVKCPVTDGPLYLTGMENAANGEGDPLKGLKYTITFKAPPEEPRVWEKLQPEPESAAHAMLSIRVGEGRSKPVVVPVTHIQANSTRVDRVPLRIVPAYTLAVEPKQKIEVLAQARKPFDVYVRVHSNAMKAAKVRTGLDVPSGWTTSAEQEIEFTGQGDRYARFTVTPPEKLAAGRYPLAAYARRGEEKFSASLEPLPTLPTQFWSEPAICRVHAFDVSVPENLRVGYITAESEPVPEALERLGIRVEMINPTELAFGNLARFDAIVVGVRAYELRSDLPGANQRLLDYAAKGGTLVVQYNRDFIWDKLQPAPYPAKVDPGKPGSPLPRITDETSPVKFLKPDDALLNRPNKITQADFDGWVQERGLYYWSQFDARYTPLLAMNDPGEPELNGGLVYTRYGLGAYIYTGLAFFRQMPEGVPGAYRLFVNLLSASRLP